MKANPFELFVTFVVLTLTPAILYSKKFRKERGYILKEVKQGRGMLND